MNLEKELQDLKDSGEAPSWMTLAGYTTISKGYRLKGETPKMMYMRVASAAAKSLGIPTLKEEFFNIMWNNWLCPASPVLSNLGTDKGLPISCYGLDVGDSVEYITKGLSELAMLSKNGGGVGVNFNRIRPRGSLIKKGANGKTDGIIGFAKMYDSTILGISQGSTRRGAASVNLDIEHGDWDEFIRMRRPEGDINRQCGNLHHCTIIRDEFMHKVVSGDTKARLKWAELMRTRMETGESYILFKDTVNRANPEAYASKGLEVDMTNICCVTGDTLVLTKEGPSKIEELVGKTVTIYDGKEWVECSNFEIRGQTDEIYEITLKSGAVIKATSKHRFPVYKNYNAIRRNKLSEKHTESLKVGDFIQMHTQESHGKHREMGAYLKGFILGDGTFDTTPKLDIHFTKYSCIPKLLASCQEIQIDNELRSDCITEPQVSKEIQQSSNSTWGKQVFRSMKGLTARKTSLLYWATTAKMELPSDVLKWDKQSKLQFLAGLLDADGTCKRFIQIVQKSKSVIKDLQLLVNTLGYAATMDTCGDNFRLTIGSFDSYLLLQELGCQRLKWQGRAPSRRLTGYRAIKSIKKLETDKVNVYCPSIPTTGYFALANGTMTGNSEITLYTDDFHSFICCLSSMNLARYDEWKDTNTVYLSILFLNGVLNEFIEKARYIYAMDRVVNSAVKGRAVGLGVLGWHTLLQEKQLPFGSFKTMQLNAEIFKHIKDESVKASQDLAKKYGEPEWCNGTGMYNTHLLAVAPTRSNSIISGDVSPGIEPIIANSYVDKSAKGAFIKRNPTLEKVLEAYGKNTDTIWKSISRENGSVQHLEFLSDDEHRVFLTAYEIDQHVIIQQAAQRQKFICQSQSLNLFFSKEVSPKYFNDVHLAAWELGVKTLYYCRSKSGLKADIANRGDECESCEG